MAALQPVWACLCPRRGDLFAARGGVRDSCPSFSSDAGTGGSMVIIGSAAGVVAMGMEKIDFMWYLKKIAFLAFIGYLAGFITFILLRDFVL